MKKTIKIIILLIMFISIIYENAVFAYTSEDGVGTIIEGTVTDGWGYWLQDGNTHMDIDIELGKSGAEESSKQMTERLLGWLQVIGSIISVIALLIIGFRYMFSSLEEKAQMKGVLIYYVVGAVLVFATSNLLSIVYKVITGLSV